MQKIINLLFWTVIICLFSSINCFAVEPEEREEIAQVSINIIAQDPLPETIPFCVGMTLKAIDCYGEEKDSMEKIISYEINGYNQIYGNPENFKPYFADGIAAGLAISDECRDADTLSRFIAEYCSEILKPFNEKIQEIYSEQ